MVRSAVCADTVSLNRHVSAVMKANEYARMSFRTSSPQKRRANYGRERAGAQAYVGPLAFADQFLDAALELALLPFALAQTFGEIRSGEFVGRRERHADEVVA